MGANPDLRIDRQGFKPVSLRKTKHYIHILYGLSSRPFDQIIQTTYDYEPASPGINGRINKAKIASPGLFGLRRLIDYPDKGFPFVVITIEFYHLVFPFTQLAFLQLGITRAYYTSRCRHQMWHEVT